LDHGADLYGKVAEDRYDGIVNDGWMLSREGTEFLSALVEVEQPRMILECGGGRSTIGLAEAAATYGGVLVSLEHDPHYVDQTRRWLDDRRLAADVRLAPLVNGWYKPSAWGDLQGIGLLVVDGPPGRTGPEARYPALPLLVARLEPDATVVLDDTDRPDERRILDRWRDEFDLVSIRTISSSYGRRTTALARGLPAPPTRNPAGAGLS
jgi:Methyltransferase domain